MDVKELVVSLLEFGTDAEVRFLIKAENDDVEEFDVVINNTYHGTSHNDVTLKIEVEGIVIHSEEDHERLEFNLDVALDKIRDLEREIESLKEEAK